MKYEKFTRYTDRTSRDALPISYVRDRIIDDYYKFKMTLDEVIEKWDDYSPEDVKKALHVYDLKKEPRPEKSKIQWFTMDIRKEWNDTCRRINPWAWRNRK